VTIATPREALCAHAAALTAIMTRVCDDPDGLTGLLADRRKNALVMGPGLGVGEKTKALVRPRSPPMPRPPSGAVPSSSTPTRSPVSRTMCAVSRG